MVLNRVQTSAAKVLPFCMLAATVACAREPANTRTQEAAVRAADSALSRAVQDKDLDRIVSFYADDASILPAASPIVRGKSAIRTEWAHLLTIPGFTNTSELGAIGISQSGDLAYTQGTYVTTFEGQAGGSLTERGKWVTVWKRQPDGSWKSVLDIYNTDALPPLHK